MIRKDGAPDMRFAWNQGPGCLSIIIFGGAGLIMIGIFLFNLYSNLRPPTRQEWVLGNTELMLMLDGARLDIHGRQITLTRENISNLTILGYGCCNYADDYDNTPLPCPDRSRCKSYTRVYFFFFNMMEDNTLYDVDAFVVYQYTDRRRDWSTNRNALTFMPKES